MHSRSRELELAWSAGLYDGEGSTTIEFQSSGRGNPFLRVSISQKDRRVLDRFRTATRVGKVYGPYRNKSIYHYVATGKKANHVLDLLFPYLGSIKKVQALRAIDAVERRTGILL